MIILIIMIIPLMINYRFSDFTTVSYILKRVGWVGFKLNSSPTFALLRGGGILQLVR